MEPKRLLNNDQIRIFMIMAYNCTNLPSYLESLILEHTLDRRVFAGRRQLRLEDDAKRAIANNLTRRVV